MSETSTKLTLSEVVKAQADQTGKTFSNDYYKAIDNLEWLFSKVPEIYESCVTRGYWKESDHHPLFQKLMLIASELAEAMEADRNGKWNNKSFSHSNDSDVPFVEYYKANIKGSVGEELADFLIRCADLCGRLTIFQPFVTGDVSESVLNHKDITFSEQLYILTSYLVIGMNQETLDITAMDRALTASMLGALYVCQLHNIDIQTHIDAKQKYAMSTFRDKENVSKAY